MIVTIKNNQFCPLKTVSCPSFFVYTKVPNPFWFRLSLLEMNYAMMSEFEIIKGFLKLLDQSMSVAIYLVYSCKSSANDWLYACITSWGTFPLATSCKRGYWWIYCTKSINVGNSLGIRISSLMVIVFIVVDILKKHVFIIQIFLSQSSKKNPLS